MRPNIFVGRVQGSAIYQKWYFEVTVDHLEQTTHMMPHLRIGWANAKGFVLQTDTKTFKANCETLLDTFHILAEARNGAETALETTSTPSASTAPFSGPEAAARK